ncbi:hypothetical protein KUCAC02_030703 [Chaenocephalus aceratus]|uniref:Uncharacterized protein n=1 Tax=Chaenocephalus aceratus TaxID=36190 RepID=A0ACB9XKY0_CHAAC|nr:hypothetical protein KUCAC02_030703 [Chaenocephalus aceratus]
MNLIRLLCRHKTALVIGTVCSFAVVLVFLAKCTSETLTQGHQDPPGLAPRANSLQSRPEQYDPTSTSKHLSVFLVVLITTGPKYTERRSIIRSTWLAKRDSDVLARFVVGTQGLPSEDLQNLNTEQGRHKDLLLLPELRDSYENLTLKLLHMYSWLDQNVEFKFVLKADDDTFARLDLLKEELKGKEPNRLYWGFFSGRGASENCWKVAGKLLGAV